MSRSAFTQQVGKKARAPHPSIAALQSIPSSQISSLRGPLLDATVAGYTNLKESGSLHRNANYLMEENEAVKNVPFQYIPFIVVARPSRNARNEEV